MNSTRKRPFLAPLNPVFKKPGAAGRPYMGKASQVGLLGLVKIVSHTVETE